MTPGSPTPGLTSRRILGIAIDERFLDHRRRSTSFAAMAAALVTGGLFEYHLIRQHRIDWDLAIVLVAMVAVKFTAMAWFHFTD
ncbi:MAG TPA: hypothetical protein VHX60_12785 [Acidobacteriaceae bacterium]|jgi:hypothetical protein|nr:hypothetical protein [Acidobacteriaceae bacterium]